MNDPNGMVYYNNTYHLMYQHYPETSVWGPMHWGHATSKDLVHWAHQPIALYPDSLGYIFSGSTVVDVNNTSGFGRNGTTPLVAIFTHHDPKGEKAGTNTFQYQSIAYSLDEGKTWTKYAGNPVVKNPGIRDFRDPKVMWHEGTKKWIMTLATLDRVTFYSSPDLKSWTRESDFGSTVGAHGGVWECPDLFALEHDGIKVWVLLVSINPGGPNKGSATQYFVGQFDGSKFTPFDTDQRWLDYGTDNYAGVTWSNTGNRKLFLGWMNNWQYATVVPTETWRGAATLPRELNLENVAGKYYVSSLPVKELGSIEGKGVTLKDIVAADTDLTGKLGELTGPARISLGAATLQSFTITLSNSKGEKLVIGYDAASNNYFIDRTSAGIVSFEKGFAAKHTAPRISTSKNLDLTLYIDNASVELFADKGLSVMTEVFFPNEPFTQIRVDAPGQYTIQELQYRPMSSIWKGSKPVVIGN